MKTTKPFFKCLLSNTATSWLMRNLLITSLMLLLSPMVKADVGDENIVMGNPSNATTNVLKSDNYLMRKKEYVLSYNNKTCNPNWVSWHLNQSWMGKAVRLDDFRPDTNLPKGWFQVKPKDYSNSGFDKGHMCNSKDRTRDAEANSATFLMDNMVPQSPKNNEHTWEQLEEHCRKVVTKGHELYIVCGPSGQGGVGKTSHGQFAPKDHLNVIRGIGLSGKIVVPAKTWKVVLILPQGKTSPKEVNSDAMTIAVIMPNSEEIDLDWTKYIVTVADVEKLTGFHFFSEINPEVAKEIKAKKYSPQK